MASGQFKLIVYGVLLVLLFLGLIRIIALSINKTFTLELMGLVFLLLLSLVGFFGYSDRWGERVFFLVFVFYLGNLALLWFFKDRLYGTLVLLGIIGFLASWPKKEEPEMKPQSEVPVKTATTTAAMATPRKRRGAYVGSLNGNVYHHRSCEWVNNIKEKVWFKSKQDARKKKYKKHKCV